MQFARYAALFFPFLIATGLASEPFTSYMVAWFGSIVILFLTLSGWVRPLPSDRRLFDQVMRPFVLVHGMFAGYNFLTSIFFFLDLNGYYYFQKDLVTMMDPQLLALTAEAQRYYVLAHAGLACGLLLGMDYRKSGKWQVRPSQNPARFLLLVALAALLVGQATAFLPGIDQIANRASKVAIVASVVALAVAIPTRKPGALLLGLGLYGFNFINAFLSGWKEEVLVMVILLALFAYPYYRRTVTFGAPAALIFLLFILPTYANIFRSMNWFGNSTAEEAASVAIETIRSGSVDMARNNWQFLVGRFSEIGIFTSYIDSFDEVGAYGFELVKQSGEALIPRAFWPEKPITEELVMERVYTFAIVSRNSRVSAKPQYVVDGFLSGRGWGVVLAGLVYGFVAVWISRKAEEWFGGYFLGSGVIFTGMFSVMWRGNSFEFITNSVVWSFVMMYGLFWLGRRTGLILPTAAAESAPAPSVQVRPSSGTMMHPRPA